MKRKFSKILGVGLTLALLTSLLLTAAPVSALSQPSVTIAAGPAGSSAGVISNQNVYTVTFTTASKVLVGEEIVIVFPAGTNITGMVAADVLIECTAGLGGGSITPAAAVSVAAATGTYPAAQTLTITPSATTIIGAGSIVQLTIGSAATAYVTNPPTIGTYSLTVATQTGATPPVAIEAAVTSVAYSIVAPAILPLPGVVERYNSAGVLMEQTNLLQTALTNSTAGDSILVGAGTYDEAITIATSVTVTGNAATTIIKDTNGSGGTDGTVTISFVGTATTGAVFDGFTVMGNLVAADALSITGHKVTVRNCIFTKPGTATTAAAQNMVNYAPGALPTLASTITNCVFDTSLGTVIDNGIKVAAGANAIGLTVSGCTFTVDGAIALEDSAVDTSGVGTALLPITISGNTIAGASGIGVTVTAGVATVSDNTLSGLNQAVTVTAGTATITGNTIDNCGLAVSTTAAAGKAAIGVTATTALSITNNNISNGPNDIIEITVGATSSNINMMFNNLTDNAKGIDNNDTVTANTLNATHNWWGVASGPATGMNVTDGAVNDTTSYLGGEATGNFALASATLITKTTVGVDVTATPAVATAPAIIGVANYTANPQAATPLPAIAGGFYDVYLADATAGDTASVLVKFYNANITANTTVYVWGTLGGGWQPVTAAAQGVNLFEGFAYANISTTTTPSVVALAGTPFALCEAPVAALTTPTLSSPDTGDDTVSLTPVFTWEAVATADGYYFEFADNANFVAPLVKLDGDYGRLIVTAYAYVTELPYSTPYYWRVKAVKGTVEAGNLAQSAWSTSVFVTMDEPEEPVPPVVISETPDIVIPAAPTPIIEPIVEVITPPATPITPAWIYAIIGVGAVLVIAVVVLIVRTRRVA